MKINKNDVGNTIIELSQDELIDALENYFKNVYENISENSKITQINCSYNNIEIEIENK